jgi:hypothetical protein
MGGERLKNVRIEHHAWIVLRALDDGELDSALKGASPDDGRSSSQADRLLEIGEAADFFHTSENIAYADIFIDGRRETHRLRSESFKQWLRVQYYKKHGGAPNSDGLQAALSTMEAQAQIDGPTREVFLRTGYHDGRFYLDLCDDEWRIVEIGPGEEGWRVIRSNEAGVRFRRVPTMRPLPVPTCDGSIDDLRTLLNIRTADEFVLVVTFLLATLRPVGKEPICARAFPVLAITGPKGAAKSGLPKIVRRLVDPNQLPIRSPSKTEQDMFIAARESLVYNVD